MLPGQHTDRVLRVGIDEPGVIRDVDTLDQYNRLCDSADSNQRSTKQKLNADER